MKNFLNSILPPPSNFYAKIGKLGRFMFLVVFTICCTTSHLTAQSKIWLHGNKIVNLSDSYNITVENLIPDNPPADIDYDNTIPKLSEHIEYDANGNILFFMVDGKIYNKDGYLMVENTNTNSNIDRYDFYPEKFISFAICKVPQQCDKYYIIGNYATSEFTSFPGRGHFFVAVLDLSQTNLFYPNDPSKLGALIDWDDIPQGYPIDLANPLHYSGLEMPVEGNLIYVNNCAVIINPEISIPSVSLPLSLTNFSILQLSNFESHMVTSQYSPYFHWSLKQDGIYFLYESDCNNLGNDCAYYYQQPTLSYDALENTIQVVDHKESPVTGNRSVRSIQSPEADMCNINLPNGIITSEISSNGNYYYYLDISGNISWIDFSQPSLVANEVLSTNSQNNSAFWTDGCKMLRNDYQGLESIYLFHTNGIDVLSNINNPNSIVYIPNIIDIGSPISESEDLWDAFGVTQAAFFSSVTTLNESTIVLSPFQIYNRQDEISPSASCCTFETNYNAEGNITINSNQTWSPGNNPFNTSGPIHIGGTITVTTGKTLQISGLELRFSEIGKIVVEKGAKLRVANNSKLTSYECDGLMWPGIIVYGLSNAQNNIPQSNSAGGNSGIVDISSNSTIENALVAIQVGTNNNNAGGVVKAINTNFINNQIDVSFYKFLYQSSSGLLGNLSYFSQCNFETNAELKNPELYPLYHVMLGGVNKIRFASCNFKNTTSTDQNTNWLNRGSGIVSLNSSFKCQGYTPSDIQFQKLNYGIVSFSFTGSILSTFQCFDMHFNGCRTGIYNLASNNIEVYNNLFTIEEVYAPSIEQDMEMGIYCTNSTGYYIEQNTFNGVDLENISGEFPAGLGVWINNSGPANNFVRNNDFSNLYFGIYGSKDNGTNDPSYQTGLQFLCNNFENDKIDIYRAALSSLRTDQGGNQFNLDQSGAAMNKFSFELPDCGVHSDFLIDPYNISYNNYYYTGNELYLPTCTSISTHPNNLYQNLLFNSIPSQNNNNCLNRYSTSSGHHNYSGGNIIAQVPRLNQSQSDLNEKLEVYAQVVDKNEKLNSLDVIETAYPEESNFVKQLLQSRYPLSDAVMKKMILYASKFDQWDLTEVFVANSPLSKDLLYTIETAEILSPFHMQFLYNANDNGGETLRKIMETNMQETNATIDSVSFDILHIALHEYPAELDSISEALNWNTIFALNLFNEKSTKNRAYAELSKFLGDASLMSQFLAEIENGNDMKQLWEFAENDSLITNNLQELDALTENSSNYVSEVSAQLLDFRVGKIETPDPTIPMQYRSLREPFVRPDKIDIPMIGVHPNPVASTGIINYPIEADGKGELVLIDSFGKEVRRINVNNNGVISFDASNFANGVYLCQLLVGNILIDSIKITILH